MLDGFFGGEKKRKSKQKKIESSNTREGRKKKKKLSNQPILLQLSHLWLCSIPLFFFILPPTIGIGIDTLSPLSQSPPSRSSNPEVPPGADPEMMALFPFAVPVPSTPPAVEVPPREWACPCPCPYPTAYAWPRECECA